MHKSNFSKALSFGLAVALVCSLFPLQPIKASETADSQKKAVAEAQESSDIDGSGIENSGIEEEIEDLEIYTVDDFLNFASQCYVDSWSVNKRVTLRADINLSGVDFEMIPVFAGIFDGYSHTISGFDYTGDGYVAGLFRYIEKEGVVENLKLRGNITAANEKECLGSICGVNYGTIKNCDFQGTVSGRDTVGGIVGTNESTGTVTGCSVSGRITG